MAERDIRAEVKAALADVTSYAAMNHDGDAEELKIETDWMEADDVERLAHALLRAAKILRGSIFLVAQCDECPATVEVESSDGRIPKELSLGHDRGRHGLLTYTMHESDRGEPADMIISSAAPR